MLLVYLHIVDDSGDRLLERLLLQDRPSHQRTPVGRECPRLFNRVDLSPLCGLLQVNRIEVSELLDLQLDFDLFALILCNLNWLIQSIDTVSDGLVLFFLHLLLWLLLLLEEHATVEAIGILRVHLEALIVVLCHLE